MTLAEPADSLTIPASALHFCDALLEHSYSLIYMSMDSNGAPDMSFVPTMEDALEKISPEICQHTLVGTINKTEAKQASVLLMVHDMAAMRMEIEPYGSMRPVKEDATSPAETAL